MNVTEIFRFLLVAKIVIALALGHGRMMDPASRNSAWRVFPDRPKQYTDNELNCGGFGAQWNKHGGKCGVCGDEYNIANPKYVHPGSFASDDFTTKTYKEGETIQVTIEITANHKGYFRFSVGKLQTRPITQEQLTHVLLQPDGSNKWQLQSSANGEYLIELVLPKGLTCDHCVLQWWWTVGNNWGKEQETFVNCADIKIIPAGGPVPTKEKPRTEKPLSSTATALPPKVPSTGSPQKPSIRSPSTGGPSKEGPTNLPTTASSTGGCKSAGAYAGQPGMDQWCVTNCAAGYCPASHCVCN